VAAKGEPEDQLRNPLEELFGVMSDLSGLSRSKLTLIGESSLSELHTRPDFAVSYSNALIGFIEVKAPGKGADPRKFKDQHDKDQWKKLAALPNLIYTDGNSFALWRSGDLVGSVQHLNGDIEFSGAALAAPAGLLSLFTDFFTWSPIPPTSPRQLAQTSAKLCQLLRDEVAEQVDRGDATLSALASDWRHLLFPGATNAQFADSYAQSVTFGLLLARARGISLEGGIDTAARTLSGSSSLIGTALRVLTDSVVRDAVLPTSVATLGRVLSVVDWPKLSKGNSEAWLYFYEDFLEVYDNKLRRKTGSYYTPVEVVQPMTRLVNEALRDRFGLADGLANPSVTLVDPAMGTGTFLLEVLRSLAATVAEDQGEGAVPSAVEAALSRLIGFEIQLGPFAVAQLRILAEIDQLGFTSASPEMLQTFVTNTLDNPFVEDETLGLMYEPIARSRREANRIKKDEPVMVVLGNPPYKEKSHGKGGWVESGTAAGHTAPLAQFIPPADWGVGAHVKHLYNLYIYFWRWATWKVFDHHPASDRGVICFITVAGFLDGAGFQQMRDYLRRRCDAVWVIDCTPEGHQPPVPTRIFEAVQQPVCIMLALRDRSTTSDTPATVHFRQLAKGLRTDKFVELAGLTLNSAQWEPCPQDWRAPFLPASTGRWTGYPALDDLLRWSGSGVMPGRTWVIASDTPTLKQRWNTFIKAKQADKPDLLTEHETDRRVDTVLSDGLPGFPSNATPIGEEHGPCPEPVRIGYRSFDRQWIIPDKRLINRPNPTLWSIRSGSQLYLTAPHDTTPTSGPAATFTADIPDLHHYKGSFGGRAFPLWLNAAGTVSNVVPGLLEQLTDRYSASVTAEDLFAYLAAVLAHPGYTAMFASDLAVPGIRVPLTADPQLFRRATTAGRRVLWLHSYGQRFCDPSDDRPKQPPRLPHDQAPRIMGSAAIPGDSGHMPDTLDHDPDKQELLVGAGRIAHVTEQMRNYEVSRVNVLDKWFSYRRRNRERPKMGDRRTSPLQRIQPESWRAEYTSELIDLLNVLGLLAETEPQQAELLTAIADGPLITVDDLTSAKVLPVPASSRKPPKVPVSPPNPGDTLDLGI
jgi:hypothetical protein